MQQYKTKTLQVPYPVYFFWSLVGLIVIGIFLYAYFVNATIFHTAERQRIEDVLVDTKSKVSQLELALIETNRNVTRTYAHQLGFVDTHELVFVERDATVSLSRNNEVNR